MRNRPAATPQIEITNVMENLQIAEERLDWTEEALQEGL